MRTVLLSQVSLKCQRAQDVMPQLVSVFQVLSTRLAVEHDCPFLACGLGTSRSPWSSRSLEASDVDRLWVDIPETAHLLGTVCVCIHRLVYAHA